MKIAGFWLANESELILNRAFSEQMIDKYGMEVEDIDDFLDAFVSTTSLVPDAHEIGSESQEINLTLESFLINGAYRHVRSYKLWRI